MNINLFKRYSRWLLGRAFRGFASTERLDSAGFVGWESDHTYTLNSIHLWQTSQVLIFLEHYLAMLQEHIAQKTLELAGFRVRGPTTRPEAWKHWKEGEPLKSSGSETSPYHVYEQIGVDFVDPRTKSESAVTSFSMLLYGPPGTGKSTIAEKLADALGNRLVTVTPSDFITAGGEGVEARAKAIFDVLTEQRDVVVLFDEIDQLLLDRDSTLYRQQGDLFKLLTPGMLTKIGELSRLRRILLVIATNYYERIDRAIKRPGRIDGRYLLLPPNRAQRARWLAHEFSNSELGFRLEDWSSISEQAKSDISCDTVRFTFKELTGLAAYVRKRNPNVHGTDLGQVILRTVRELPPIITLEAYGPRLGVDGNKPVDIEQPWEEFALLSYLELEAKQKLPDKPNWVESAVRTALERRAVADQTIADDLAAILPPPTSLPCA